MIKVPLRNRCKVLQAIAAHGPITCKGLEKHIPDMDAHQIQQAAYNLRQQDRVEKVGEQERTGSNGRPLVVLEVTDRETAKIPRKTPYRKKPRTHSQQLQTGSGLVNTVVRFRERKIAILTTFANASGGTDKDVIIGMIKDYGGTFDGT